MACAVHLVSTHWVSLYCNTALTTKEFVLFMNEELLFPARFHVCAVYWTHPSSRLISLIEACSFLYVCHNVCGQYSIFIYCKTKSKGSHQASQCGSQCNWNTIIAIELVIKWHTKQDEGYVWRITPGINADGGHFHLTTSQLINQSVIE